MRCIPLFGYGYPDHLRCGGDRLGGLFHGLRKRDDTGMVILKAAAGFIAD